MRRRLRLAALGASLAALGWSMVRAFAALPAFGTSPGGTAGELIVRLSPEALGVANATAAVNFSFRVLDTLGEEFILVSAVLGVSLLLRESEDARTREPNPADLLTVDRSEAVRWLGPWIVVVTVLYGAHLALHGHVSPGGGFQGGAIVASGLLAVFFVAGWAAFRDLSSTRVLETVEGAAIAGFVLAGMASAAASGDFFRDALPDGSPGRLLSGGLVTILNLLVGVAVGAGFGLVFRHYVEEVVTPPPPPEATS